MDECDYTCSCMPANVRGQCMACASHPSARERVLKRGWGVGGTDKRHLARRAKNNKGNLGSSDILDRQPLCAEVYCVCVCVGGIVC